MKLKELEQDWIEKREALNHLCAVRDAIIEKAQNDPDLAKAQQEFNAAKAAFDKARAQEIAAVK